jgi:hypothetical protein
MFHKEKRRTPRTKMPITLEAASEARRNIAGFAIRTPLVRLNTDDHEVYLKRVLPARLRKLGFLLGQEAADGGSADLKLAGDFGFADSLPM